MNPRDPRTFSGFMDIPRMERWLFGSDFVFPAASRLNVSQNIVNILTDIKCIIPTVIGVQINTIVNNAAFGAGSVPGLRAEITWGVDGGNFTAIVDAIPGMSINVVAQTLNIKLIDESIYVGGGIASLASPFRGTASCVFGGLPKTQPATRTVRPAPLVTSVVTIPKFARRLNVTRFDSTLATSNYSLLILDNAGSTVGNVVVAAGVDLEEYLLPGRSATLTPTLGVGVTEMSYVFSLDL